MYAPHSGVPFPNLEGSRFKSFWATFLQCADGKSCDVIVSTKPRIERISPPLMHISGVSNDFTSASGQWRLCETLDPNVRQQQRELVDKLLADDHSTLFRSAEASHLTVEYKMRHLGLRKDLLELVHPQNRRAAVEYPSLRTATTVTAESAASAVTPTNRVVNLPTQIHRVTEQEPQNPPPYDHPDHSVGDEKPRECNPAVTFDTFVEKHQLVEGDQEARVRRRHCDQLLKWLKDRLQTRSRRRRG
jgi:hypothetical protein